jgi:pimeloyl-ACP methyl ester carboxylesterase
VIALSLTSEFAAHAALSEPDLFHSLTMISPTGFSERKNKNDIQKANEGRNADKNYATLANPLWAQSFYDLLVTKPSISYFLREGFYGPSDPGLAEYSYLTAHQPGARFAPLHFVSGKLFTPSIMTSVYQKLQVPVLVLFDQDPNVTFELLPRLLESNQNWRARRIPNTRALPHFERMGKVADELNAQWSELEQIEA